ncbi:MAG: sarcosine oxidase subunit gamma family protein [Pseudomonadota bacterium]
MADTASNRGETSLAAFAASFADTSKQGEVTIRECRLAQQVNLRGDSADKAVIKGAKAALGCDLPLDACTVASAKAGHKVLWLGPDEWLVVAEDAAAASFADLLSEKLADQHVSIVNLDQNRLVIELSGPRAREVLEKACLQDLHPSAFTPGRIVGTIMFKTQVFLEQIDDQPTYWLYVRPSFSRHLAEMLLDAMAEFVS